MVGSLFVMSQGQIVHELTAREIAAAGAAARAAAPAGGEYAISPGATCVRQGKLFYLSTARAAAAAVTRPTAITETAAP